MARWTTTSAPATDESGNHVTARRHGLRSLPDQARASSTFDWWGACALRTTVVALYVQSLTDPLDNLLTLKAGGGLILSDRLGPRPTTPRLRQ